MSKEHKLNGKRMAINIVILFSVVLIVLLFSYGCYIVRVVSPIVPDSLNEIYGRMYGNVEKDFFLLIESDGDMTISSKGEEWIVPTSEYVDGILRLIDTEEETVYTFLFVSDDRMYSKDYNLYMELIWVSV